MVSKRTQDRSCIFGDMIYNMYICKITLSEKVIATNQNITNFSFNFFFKSKHLSSKFDIQYLIC